MRCDARGGRNCYVGGARRAFTRSSTPHVRFHDLRHTAATLMLSAGTHPKVVSERLGHATIHITPDTYSHVLPDLQHEAAAVIDALLTEAIWCRQSAGKC